MRVCLTGSDGYLGSLLAPELMRRGHHVVGLDTGYYKERSLSRGRAKYVNKMIFSTQATHDCRRHDSLERAEKNRPFHLE